MFNKTHTIQELIDLGVIQIGDGYRAKNSELTMAGLPFARAGNLNNGFNFDGADRFPSKNIEKVGYKISQSWDCVFTSKGTVGRIALVKDDTEQFVYSPQLCYWRSIKHDIIDPVFLYYWMQGYEFKHQIDYLKGQTDMADYVNLRDQKKMKMTVPDLDRQQEIKSHLFALDNKIELNRQTNQTLEHIAQAIFKSWFVDFEPTRAKIIAKQNGQDPERAALSAISGKPLDQLDQLSPENQQQLKTTAALFPDTLVDSELGEIPEGWSAKPLSDIADIIMGHSPKGDTYNNSGIGTPLVNGPVEFGSYHTKRIKWTTSPTRMSRKRDLVVCVRGSTTGRYVKSDGEYCLGRGVCAIRSKHQAFIDYLYKNEMSKLLGLTTGSTFSSWNGPVLKGHRVIGPLELLMDEYSRIVEEIELKISKTENESTTLSSLRNTMLPKLLSGEISVKHEA